MKLFLNFQVDLEVQAVMQSLNLQQSTMVTWLLSVSKLVRKLHKKLLILTLRPKYPLNKNSLKQKQSISQAFRSSHSKITLLKISEISQPISSLKPLILALSHLQRCLDKAVTTITMLRSLQWCKKQNNANKRSWRAHTKLSKMSQKPKGKERWLELQPFSSGRLPVSSKSNKLELTTNWSKRTKLKKPAQWKVRQTHGRPF